jgi:homocysteine S-methyltransferase
VAVSSFSDALGAGPLVLDGGLATELERQGHDLSSELWSARVLADDPAAVVAAHRSFFAAGAQVATTASYQVSAEGFARVGQDGLAVSRLLRRSVRLAREAADEVDGGAWVAGSVGPYGAARADGSEYRGDYGLDVAELRRWHHFGVRVLADAGPDVLALETVPCLAEAEALLREVEDLGLPCWLSLTCVGDRTRAGEPAAEAFAMAADVDAVVAVGVNCLDPADAGPLVRLAGALSGKPVVVYPNSGERWDAAARRWFGPATDLAGAVPGWLDDGAALVGGCCRVSPDTIAAIAAEVSERRSQPTHTQP